MSRATAQNPDRPKRLLFLYVSPSGGHRECADAVRKAFAQRHPYRIETAGVDAISSLYPVLGPLIDRTYLEILRRTPQIWDYLYDNRGIEGLTREFRQFFNFVNDPKLKYLLDQYGPDAIICTHAVPCGIIAEQKKRGHCALPLVGIVTDHGVHSYWAHPEVDLYIVANLESKKALLANGVSGQRIKVCGIPVNPEFSQKADAESAKSKLGMDPSKPAVLVMGGARGLGPIKRITEDILSIGPDLQVMVVTGTNQELEKDLAGYGKLKNARVYGYTRLVPILMDAACLLITKPGGITTSEALVKGLPMVLVDPIPGQEERNARFLLKNRTAIRIQNMGELKPAVQGLLNDPVRMGELSENARRISAPGSAADAAREIMEFCAVAAATRPALVGTFS